MRRQVSAGVDIVNDGEMSKPGYSTYVADRLSGFAGHEPAKPRLDTGPYPNFQRHRLYARMTGENAARRGPVCVGAPIEVKDREPLRAPLLAESGNPRSAAAPTRSRGSHGRGLAGSRAGVPEQQALPVARGLCRGARGGDAARIRGDRRCRVCSCSSVAPTSRWRTTPRSRITERGPIPPEARRVPRRGAEPRRPATSPPTGCASTSAGAITRGRTITTSISARSRRSSSKARPQALLVEAAEPAPRP